MIHILTSDDLKGRDELVIELAMMRLSCSRLVDQVMEMKAEAEYWKRRALQIPETSKTEAT